MNFARGLAVLCTDSGIFAAQPVAQTYLRPERYRMRFESALTFGTSLRIGSNQPSKYSHTTPTKFSRQSFERLAKRHAIGTRCASLVRSDE